MASVSAGDVVADNVFVGVMEEEVLDGGTAQNEVLVEEEVLEASADLTISSNYTLDKDTTVAGNLTILWF